MNGISNCGYHYLGAAKNLAPISKSIAEAMMNFQKPKPKGNP